MQYIVLGFGVFLVAAGISLLIKPSLVFSLLDRNKDSTGIHVLAVVMRLVLGGALIMSADVSGFPMTFKILGWITLLAAIVLAVMGRANFRKLMDWAMGLADKFGRVAGIASVLLGGFLIYAIR